MKQLTQLLNLKGKSAIVTGGAKGIGQGIAYRLAEAGAKILIADLDEATARQTAQELSAKGWAAEACKVDVSSEEDVKNMVALFLASDMSSYMTGEQIVVNGGALLS